jgi:hypothetical protein
MDDEPKHRPSRVAKVEAVKAVNTSSTKKRSASTHGSAGRAQKARKTAPSAPSAPSARMDEGAEDVSTQFHKTPATKRQASHTNLIEHETIYASDMQKQIAAEARGVTRKNIPWDKFCSIYLCDFSVAQPKLAVESVKKIGEGNWEEQLFWGRLHQSLSHGVRCLGCAFMRLSVFC